MRWMWSQGDYPRVAEVLEPHAEALAEACQITPGATVLDVAAGTGNFALAAARRGAIVTATDLTPLMVELGRARSAATGVSIRWAEADAEQLPYEDASYDIVASVFGAMFAPRPQLVAADVYRRAQTEKEQLVRELNESGDGRLKVSSPYILVIARVGSYMTPASPPPGRASRGRPPHTVGRRDGDVAARQYDAMAAEYAADNEEGAYNAYYERPATIALLGDVAGLDVLEVGCGAGPLTAYLVEHGAAVTATDVSAEMVRLAKTRVGDRATFHVTSIEKPMPFARDHSYDLVVGSLVMHYVRDWEPVLREFRRVLRPGGAVVFSTHHPTMDWELSPGDYFSTTQITETWKKGSGEFEVTFWRRPLTEMTRAIAATGFVIEQLVEPQPLRELSERSPRDYANLSTKPQFLFFRLRPG